MFEEIKNEKLYDVNGGGIAGALAGYIIGNYVGALVGMACSSISKKCGDSARVASDVGVTAYAATVALFTFAGALLPA